MFVDRETELGLLRDAFAEASTGRSRIVIVEGEAGIGKTTLLERFLGELREVRVLRASGDEFESHLPFATADQLLRSAGSGSDALAAGSHLAVGLELLELIGSSDEEAGAGGVRPARVIARYRPISSLRCRTCSFVMCLPRISLGSMPTRHVSDCRGPSTCDAGCDRTLRARSER